MNINYKQSQFELFPAASSNSSDAVKPRYLFANLTLSIENIVVIGILTLMVMVIAFSLGVEKGKKISDIPLSLDPPENLIVLQNSSYVQTSGVAKVNRSRSEVDALTGNERAFFGHADAIPPRGSQDKDHAAKVSVSNSASPAQKILSKSAVSVYKDQAAGPRVSHKVASTGSVSSSNIVNAAHGKVAPTAVSQVKNTPVIDNKPYTIQVASFKGDQYAQKEAIELKNKKFDAFVINKGDFFIVCVGKFSKREDANKLLSKLKRNYNDCLLRRF